MENMEHNNEEKSNYRPLIVLISAILLGAFALESGHPDFQWVHFTNYFMGLFFLLFAMFKLFDLNGFADGFQMYDLIAKKERRYAYVYPFIELALGLLYLGEHVLVLTNLITLVVMSVSAVGVIKSVTGGMKIKCACLGTVLSVPLSTVSIVENVGMGIMATVMLLYIGQ